MADVGTLVLRRFNGDEVYGLETAEILAIREEDAVALWLEVSTAGTPLQGLPDTASLDAHPSAEVRVRLTKLDPDQLVGRHFTIPRGYDREEDEHVSTIYYCEHEDLDDNEIDILSCEGSVFRVRWTGSTTNVNYYDGSKPRTRVEIEGQFSFRKIDEWRA